MGFSVPGASLFTFPARGVLFFLWLWPNPLAPPSPRFTRFTISFEHRKYAVNGLIPSPKRSPFANSLPSVFNVSSYRAFAVGGGPGFCQVIPCQLGYKAASPPFRPVRPVFSLFRSPITICFLAGLRGLPPQLLAGSAQFYLARPRMCPQFFSLPCDAVDPSPLFPPPTFLFLRVSDF